MSSSCDDDNKGYVWKQIKLFEQQEHELQMDSKRSRKPKGVPNKSGRNQNTSQKLKEVLTIKRPNKGKVNSDNNKDPSMNRGAARSSLPKSKSLHNSTDKNPKDFKRQNSLASAYTDFEKEKKKVLEDIELNNDIVEKFGEKLRQRRNSSRSQDEPNNTIENFPIVKTKNSNSSKDDNKDKTKSTISQPTKTSNLQRSSVIKEETFVFDRKEIYRKSGNTSSMKYKNSDNKTKSKSSDFKRQYSSPNQANGVKLGSANHQHTAPSSQIEQFAHHSKVDNVPTSGTVEKLIKMLDKTSDDTNRPTLTTQISFESEIEKKITDSLENLDKLENSEDHLKKIEEFRRSANFEIDKSLEQIRISCQELDNLSYDTPTSSRKSKSKFDEYLEKRASAFPVLETERYAIKREEYDFGESSFSERDYYVEACNLDDSELIITEMQITRKRMSAAWEDDHKLNGTSSRLESLSESLTGSDLVFAVENETESHQVFVEDDFSGFSTTESKYDSGIANSTESVHTYESLTEFNQEDKEGDYVDLKRSKSLSHLNDATQENIYEDISDVRQTIIKDDDGNIRIEAPINRQESSTKKPKLNYIIDELKTSEKQYLRNLKKVVDEYIPYMIHNTPKHLVGKTCYLFGNIENIYEEEKLFYEDLEKCEADPTKIAKAFLDHAKLFKQYPIYFKNKPKADILLKDFRRVLKEAQFYFKDKLELNAYLLTPIQRLGKFILLLENIASELGKVRHPNTKILEAITLVRTEMMNGNDQIAIDSIMNCPIRLEEYGPFRMRDTFQCLKPKRGTLVLFLFEKIIIITVPSQKNSEQYNYEDSILFNDLSVKLGEEDTTEIELYNFARSKKSQEKHCYQLLAKSVKTKEEWYAVIEMKLWQQVDEVKRSVQMLYSSKNSGTLQRHSSHNTGNPAAVRKSTFYVNYK